MGCYATLRAILSNFFRLPKPLHPINILAVRFPALHFDPSFATAEYVYLTTTTYAINDTCCSYLKHAPDIRRFWAPWVTGGNDVHRAQLLHEEWMQMRSCRNVLRDQSCAACNGIYVTIYTGCRVRCIDDAPVKLVSTNGPGTNIDTSVDVEDQVIERDNFGLPLNRRVPNCFRPTGRKMYGDVFVLRVADAEWGEKEREALFVDVCGNLLQMAEVNIVKPAVKGLAEMPKGEPAELMQLEGIGVAM